MTEKGYAGEPEGLSFYLTRRKVGDIVREHFDEADRMNPKNPWYIFENSPRLKIVPLEDKITAAIMNPRTGKRKLGRKPAWLLEILKDVEEGERDYSIEDIMAEESRGDSILLNISGKEDAEVIGRYHRRARKYNGTNQFGAHLSQETIKLMETIDDKALEIARNYAVGTLKKIARGSEKNRYFRPEEIAAALKEMPEVRQALHSELKHLDEKERWTEIFKKIFSDEGIQYMLEHNFTQDSENPQSIIADTKDILVKSLYYSSLGDLENVYRPARINGN